MQRNRRKIGDIRGKVHVKMGTIKDRIGKDLVKAEEIKKRGRWEGGLGWGIHVYPRLIHVNV